MVSLLVSFTLTPMMSSRLLSAKDAEQGGHGSRGGFYARIDAVYMRMLEFSMSHRKIVTVVALVVILMSIPLYKAVKQEFIPTNVDEAEFDVSINAPQGTSLAAMNEAMVEIEKELMATPGVRLVLASAGGGFLSATSSGSAYVRIAPHEERTLSFTKFWHSLKSGKPWNVFRGNYSAQDVMQDVRKRTRKFAPIRVAPRNPPSFNFGPGGRSDINFVIRGPELTQLAAYADELVSRTNKLRGFNDVDTNLELDKPELRANIDRARAADLGVNTSDIATSLNVMVGGDQEVTRYRDPAMNEDYDVQLRVERANRDDPAAIGRLYVPTQSGGLVRLDNVVDIERGISPSRIDRLDRERQVTVSASVAPGFALADRIEAMRGEIAKMGLAAGYTTTVTGRGRELERTFREFLWAFLLSIIFMYMILASQFESTVHPITILLSLPLAVPFALLSQWVTGSTLNLYSALGILVLFGVVKKNSILQVDHMNNLRAHGMDRASAILQANRDRLRPILMTTLALVAGMLPLALGTGPGAEERRSIAVVVIGGQSLSLLLTLLVTPVAYSLFDDLTLSRRWRPVVIRLQRARERVALAFAPLRRRR
jgi:HAE1 family hydrophobic/amphiphilic exporter-1